VRQPQQHNPAPSTAASTLPAVPMPMEGESTARASAHTPTFSPPAPIQRHSSDRVASRALVKKLSRSSQWHHRRRLSTRLNAARRGMGGGQWSARLRHEESPSWTR